MSDENGDEGQVIINDDNNESFHSISDDILGNDKSLKILTMSEAGDDDDAQIVYSDIKTKLTEKIKCEPDIENQCNYGTSTEDLMVTFSKLQWKQEKINFFSPYQLDGQIDTFYVVKRKDQYGNDCRMSDLNAYKNNIAKKLKTEMKQSKFSSTPVNKPISTSSILELPRIPKKKIEEKSVKQHSSVKRLLSSDTYAPTKSRVQTGRVIKKMKQKTSLLKRVSSQTKVNQSMFPKSTVQSSTNIVTTLQQRNPIMNKQRKTDTKVLQNVSPFLSMPLKSSIGSSANTDNIVASLSNKQTIKHSLNERTDIITHERHAMQKKALDESHFVKRPLSIWDVVEDVNNKIPQVSTKNEQNKRVVINGVVKDGRKSVPSYNAQKSCDSMKMNSNKSNNQPLIKRLSSIVETPKKLSAANDSGRTSPLNIFVGLGAEQRSSFSDMKRLPLTINKTARLNERVKTKSDIIARSAKLPHSTIQSKKEKMHTYKNPLVTKPQLFKSLSTNSSLNSIQDRRQVKKKSYDHNLFSKDRKQKEKEVDKNSSAKFVESIQRINLSNIIIIRRQVRKKSSIENKNHNCTTVITAMTNSPKTSTTTTGHITITPLIQTQCKRSNNYFDGCITIDDDEDIEEVYLKCYNKACTLLYNIRARETFLDNSCDCSVMRLRWLNTLESLLIEHIQISFDLSIYPQRQEYQQRNPKNFFKIKTEIPDDDDYASSLIPTTLISNSIVKCEPIENLLPLVPLTNKPNKTTKSYMIESKLVTVVMRTFIKMYLLKSFDDSQHYITFTPFAITSYLRYLLTEISSSHHHIINNNDVDECERCKDFKILLSSLFDLLIDLLEFDVCGFQKKKFRSELIETDYFNEFRRQSQSSLKQQQAKMDKIKYIFYLIELIGVYLFRLPLSYTLNKADAYFESIQSCMKYILQSWNR
ncbi:unnamed protein product [Didymodactylos carnosus]|uniref:Uncharacterized protein n=1 Tax=Didymodactylos carnosus TaxID=1234261 RepID=A0A8S2KNU7_9BILA|nr:unnamed protein product [Didymodactylos carnosus]CAF3861018.1 unnamed protein product [Didymodactylos carnosus]